MFHESKIELHKRNDKELFKRMFSLHEKKMACQKQRHMFVQISVYDNILSQETTTFFVTDEMQLV